jgi:hypothetical protein
MPDVTARRRVASISDPKCTIPSMNKIGQVFRILLPTGNEPDIYLFLYGLFNDF